MRDSSTGARMLGRPREANHSPDERVVAAVRSSLTLGEQLVEAMGGLRAPTRWHIEAQCPEPWAGHRNQQRRLALATSGEIVEPCSHELVTRKIDWNILHFPQ
jgi:hypothetical protein